MLNRSTLALLRAVAAAAVIAGYFLLVHRFVPDASRGVHITKLVVAAVAAGAFFYERQREGERRPVAERWKRFVGISLAVLSIALYYNEFRGGYAKWYHRHDQYHYYFGAKYFAELGYDRLYRCTLVAEEELGTITDARGRAYDLKRETHHPDRKVRDLGATNLLIPAEQVLADPAVCKSHFSPERWDSFKRDIKFFRLESDKDYWQSMQKDHGFNPPPVWTLIGRFVAELSPASVGFQQLLGGLDIVFMTATLLVLGWAFGWRVFAVGAIFWGCEGAADPYYWTGGAFLRQDWLFFTVLAVCLARKRYYALAAASIVHAALLRVFPGVLVIGWLVVAGWHLVRHRRLAPQHLRMLIGGTVAAVVLVGASMHFVGKDSYREFYRHTIVVHDRTPLTNHMGLRVLISQHPGKFGRVKYTKDDKLLDPFEVWKQRRMDRWERYRWIAGLVMLATFGAFAYVLRRVRLPWVAMGLSVVWVILVAQLTNYYYGFLLCAVPLLRVRRDLEILFYGYVILSQIVWLTAYWTDDKYALETIVALLFSYVLLAAFWPRRLHDRDPVG